jgi:Zn-finger nucleic acid-binding protein
MTTRHAAGTDVTGCHECGGIWLAASDLKRTAQNGRRALIELENAFHASGALTTTAATLLCPDCGATLLPRSLRGASGIDFMDCAACRRLFITEGQVKQLADKITPLAVPQAFEAPVLDEEQEAIARAERVRGGLARLWWEERAEGQPWPAWFVAAMPLWFAALVGLVPALTTYFASSRGKMAVGLPIGVLLAVFGAAWLMQSLALFLALRLTWSVFEEDPGLDWYQTFVLALRAAPVVDLAARLVKMGVVGFFLLWSGFTSNAANGVAAGGCMFGCIGGLAAFLARLLLYRTFLELERGSMWVVAIVQWLVNFFGEAALLAAAATIVGLPSPVG